MESAAMSIEQLDQEITLHLQTIDSDLSYCFAKITKDIIPYVTRYGQTCEELSHSSSWLKEIFQQSANVQLVTDQAVESAGQVLEPRASLFPEVDAETEQFLTVNQMPGAKPRDNTGDAGAAYDDSEQLTEDSAMEKQRKKRKVSLQIHQQFNSSSSNSSMDKDLTENSSPIKMVVADAAQGTETDIQQLKPGTVIHFNSKTREAR